MAYFTRLLFAFCGALLLLGRCHSARINKIEKEQPLPPEYEDLGVPGTESDDDIKEYQGVRGRAGVDFPMLRKIPKTSFSCRAMKTSGYFADLDTGCQVFHLCEGGRKMSFLCPNGTIFRQSKLTCDWWFKVDCKSSEDFYDSSAEQLRQDRGSTKNVEVTTLKNKEEEVATEKYDDIPTTFRSRVRTHVSQHLAQERRGRLYEESQEVAETGSFIIPRRQQEIYESLGLKYESHNTKYESRDRKQTVTYSNVRTTTEDTPRETTYESRDNKQTERYLNFETTTQDTPRETNYESRDNRQTANYLNFRTTTQDTPQETNYESRDNKQTASYLNFRSTNSPQFPTTTQLPVTTKSPVAFGTRFDFTTTTWRPEVTTVPPEFTTEQTTTPERGYDSTSTTSWEDATTTQLPETLLGSHSSYYNSPGVTNLPPTTQEDFRRVSFFTTPEPTLLPPTIRPLAGTERDSRGFIANPRPRPGLTDVPLSASPLTLHSLARYFAADNQTRREMEKEVSPNTMKLMESLMPEMETTTENLNKLSPDLRQLAQIFSKALSDYLEDPEGFRQALTSIRPTGPPPFNNFLDEEKDEVLDFSDTVNTKKGRTTTTELPETVTYPATEYPIKNEVASIVNEVLQEPTARKVPDNTLINEETQYRFSTPGDINHLTYFSNHNYPSTTVQPNVNTVAENIPNPTTYPIHPETIPQTDEDRYPYSVPLVEIGYDKPKFTNNEFTFEPEPIQTNKGFDQPSLQAVLKHFAPHDLNSLAIFSVHTNPNPSPAPLSVAVHLNPQSHLQHRVTVVTSTHNNVNSKHGTTYKPMISSLLFPSPTGNAENKSLDVQETLLSENTASFPASFSNAQSIIQASKDRILKSWLNEDKSVSQLITETIPTTPASTFEPITEEIPTNIPYTQDIQRDQSLDQRASIESQDGYDFNVPRARKVGDEDAGQQLVLLLVKNGAKVQDSEDINNSKLLQALIQSDSNQVNNASNVNDYTTLDVTTTTAQQASENKRHTKEPEVTTYRSALHQKILEKVRESEEIEALPQPQSLVDQLPSIETTHSDSRAVNILKSLYSLASRWG